MIKFFSTFILCTTLAISAHIPRFEHEEYLARLYLDVDVSTEPRIRIQKLEEQYHEWLHSLQNLSVTKQDMIYIDRVYALFAEVYISYHYGN